MMLGWFILGLTLLIGILLAARWYASAQPKTVLRVFMLLLGGGIILVALFFLLTGRFTWALFTLPALLPWIARLRQAKRLAGNFRRMRQGRAGDGRSDVETAFLRVSLDHESGALSGEVLAGRFQGRLLQQMALGELLSLLEECRADTESHQVLESYLDREYPEWRDGASPGGNGPGNGGPGNGGSGMNRAEAYQVLGLQPGARDAEIKDAHRRLIAGLHPDHGGSTYLAAKINEAKDILLGSG